MILRYTGPKNIKAELPNKENTVIKRSLVYQYSCQPKDSGGPSVQYSDHKLNNVLNE